MDLEAGVKPSFGEDMGEVMLPDRWAEDDARSPPMSTEAMQKAMQRPWVVEVSARIASRTTAQTLGERGFEVFGDTQSFDDSPSLRPHGWEEDVTPVDEQTWRRGRRRFCPCLRWSVAVERSSIQALRARQCPADADRTRPA